MTQSRLHVMSLTCGRGVPSYTSQLAAFVARQFLGGIMQASKWFGLSAVIVALAMIAMAQAAPSADRKKKSSTSR